MKTITFKRGFKKFFTLSFLMLSVLVLTSSTTYAYTAFERRELAKKGIYFLDEPCPVAARGAYAPISGMDYQVANAKAIIGIAKTLNLGERGALIGLMVGLAESSLRNYANDGTYVKGRTQPYKNTQLSAISQSLPHDAVGHDNDSVGIMQQRAIDGHWGPVDPKRDLAGNIKWLMTPTYAAEAFFAMPAGKKEQKALVKVPNWQTIDPATAAQAVQRSGVSNGQNYRNRQAAAQALLNQHYATTLGIPLPVPLASEGEGSVEPGTGDLAACNNLGGGSAAILAKIREYAWDHYITFGSGQSPLTRKEAYIYAVAHSRYKGDPCYGGGVDCGAFTTIVMRDSGADPNYNTGPQGNTTAQIAYLRRNSKPGGKYTKVATKDQLQPGDIAVRADGDPFKGRGGHTFFFVGNGIPGWGGQAASASQCDRAPMASGSDTFEQYEWYHLN
jgi:hypothetical protein